jgi:23S rRNA (uridine2552-2'-O)-methyltransferase
MTRRSKSVVLSDMAPNMRAMDGVDPAKSSCLGELALDMTDRVLNPHGHALIKVSKAPDAGAGQAVPRQICPGEAAQAGRFRRAWSAEMYLLATDFRLV